MGRPDDRRGWWGDGLDVRADLGEAPLGSLLWLLERSAIDTVETPRWARAFALDALMPLVNCGAVARTDAQAWVSKSPNRLDLAVQLYGRDGAKVYDRRFDDVWAQITASAPATLSAAGVLAVPVISATAANAANAQPGTPFTILSGVTGPGVSGATVAADASGLSGGLDIEPDGLPRSADLGTLRGRILFRKRNPPQGGAPADYVQWASAVPGVTRVFVERLYAGRGSVRVFPIRHRGRIGQGDGRRGRGLRGRDGVTPWPTRRSSSSCSTPTRSTSATTGKSRSR